MQEVLRMNSFKELYESLDVDTDTVQKKYRGGFIK